MSSTSLPVAEGHVAGIYYTLKDASGTVLDTNRKGGKPLAFLCGSGNILPGLEKELLGKKKNEEVVVVLSAADGYGERKEELVEPVPRTEFSPDMDLAVGLRVSMKSPEGQVRAGSIAEIGDDEVKIDWNHPLAGQDLHFEVLIVGVREPRPEETEHGHAHGPGGHHH